MGSYDITEGTLVLSSNYSLSYVGEKLTIGKADLSVKANDKTRKYNLVNPILDGTLSGVVAGDGITASYSTMATQSSDVGDYAITATLSDPNSKLSNYNLTNTSGKLTITQADASISISGLEKTYNGTAQGATVSTTPSGLAINVTYDGGATVPINAGFYEVMAKLNNNNYSASDANATLHIAKADADISVTPYNVTYDGDAHASSGSAKGLESSPLDLSSLLTLSGTTHTNARNYTGDVWSFAGNSNYNSAQGAVDNKIAKADPVIDVKGYDDIYDGNTHGATGTIKGVKDEPLSGLDLGASFTNVPGGPVNWKYTDATGNYNDMNGSVAIAIGKANATITITPYEVTYDGNEHGASGSVTGVQGESLSGLDLSNTKHINAGTFATDNWSFTDVTGNYNDVAATTITNKINKAASVTTITITGAPFTYTGEAQMPALVSVTGVGGLALAPDASYANNINAGTASVSYTYAGDDNHLGSSDSKTFFIDKADPVIAVQGYNGTYDGTAHGASGTIRGVKDEPLSGLDLGTSYTNVPGGTANWSYTDATGNYNDKNGSVAINIGKATATIAFGNLNFIYDGNEKLATATTTPANLSGLSVGGAGTDAGDYAASASLNNQNYLAIPIAGTLKIGKATSSTTITITGAPFTYTGEAHTPATVSVTGACGLNLTPTATYADNTNAGTATASYIFAGDANHEGSQASETFEIGKAKPLITLTYGGVVNYDGQPHYVTSATVTGVGTPSQNLGNATVEYKQGTNTIAHPTNAGTYDVTASFAGNSNYEAADVKSGTLTINKVPLTVTVKGASKYVGQANPSFDVDYAGYVNNETKSVLSGTINYTTTATTTSCAGPYDVTANGLSAINYDITYKKGILTVNGVSVDASASGSPIPFGSTATLVAYVLPQVAGVNVTFKLDGTVKGSSLTDASGKAILPVTVSAVNVYQVEAFVATGCNTSSVSYLPAYDPNAGFVTGGGWVNSPEGAYVAEPTATGKANFGFVAKYKKGSAAALEGETEFQFQSGNMKFNSTSYEAATLVISGAKASYRGVGTINGTGSYKFTLIATDGQVLGGGGADKIRMKIVNTATGLVVYDNQIQSADNADPTTVLGGGCIVIHDGKSNKAVAARVDIDEMATATEFGLKVFPNPTTFQFNIKLESSNTEDLITLRITDLSGRVVRQIPSLTTGQIIQLGSEYKPGIYIVEMVQGNSRKQLKLIKQSN